MLDAITSTNQHALARRYERSRNATTAPEKDGATMRRGTNLHREAFFTP